MAEYFVGITDKGKRRDQNEDTFIAREFLKKEFVVACVIDGVGGYNGGEIAAAITRSVILEHLKSVKGSITETLQAAIIAANVKIQEERKKDIQNEQMACVLTCAVADIKNNKLYYAHVGDTRLYLLRDRSLVKLSKDHSVVGYLEESGRLSEEDAMRHPRRNEITKALGFEENITGVNDFIETGESPFLPGDMILVCSDGLSDMVASDTITEILLKESSISQKAAELVQAANDAGGNDNITVVLVQNYKQPVPKVVLKPIEKKDKEKKEQRVFTRTKNDNQPIKPARRSRSLVVLVSLLSLVLLAVLAFKNYSLAKEDKPVLKTEIVEQKNENLELLNRSIHDSSKMYVAANGVSELALSEPLLISKDSFVIRGNGITISSDSNYKGPALIVDKSSKCILLDSIVFKDFDIAMIVQKNNVELKNVRFINCRVPVQYQIVLSDTILSGRLKDSLFTPVSTFKKR